MTKGMTATPIATKRPIATTTADALMHHYAAERDSLLARVDSIEKNLLHYGTNDHPTTAQIRAAWRKYKGVCPHCGMGINGEGEDGG